MTPFKINCSTEYRTSWQCAKHHTLTSISTKKKKQKQKTDSQCRSELGGKRASPPWGRMCCDVSDGRDFLPHPKVYFIVSIIIHILCVSLRIESTAMTKKKFTQKSMNMSLRHPESLKVQITFSIYGYLTE